MSLSPHIPVEPIAEDSELRGAVHSAHGAVFFTVKGPCGEGHTMSREEARRLRDWLSTNLGDDNDPNWRLTIKE